MNVGDVLLWSLALVAFACSAGITTMLVVLVTRFLEEQRSNLAAHRAKAAQAIAEAKAAEQRAELEAADILERRLALPFAGTTSLGEELTAKGAQLEKRLDQAAEIVERTRRDQEILADQMATLFRRMDMLLKRAPAVTHTDAPLSPRQAVSDAHGAGKGVQR